MQLKIGSSDFDFFSDFTVTLNYDSVASSFSINAFFNPDNDDHRFLFEPLAYRPVVLSEEGEKLLTGRILNSGFTLTKVDALTNITGYSLPGVLEDSQIPTSLYPLQSDGRTLLQITRRLIQPFGLNLVVDPQVAARANKVYQKTIAKESQSIKAYLSELASQRDIIITHDQNGSLVLTQANLNVQPVTSFIEGEKSFTSMKLSTNGQRMHSDITLIRQAKIDGDNAGQSKINNPFVDIFRPSTKVQSSGTDNDTSEAARNLLGQELQNIKLTIETERWTWLNNGNDEIMRPNNIISVQAPSLFIYDKTDFFVQSVTLFGDKEKQIATLVCVLPEVYNQKDPINIFNS